MSEFNFLPALIFLALFSAIGFLLDVMARDHWSYSDPATWRTWSIIAAFVIFGVASCLYGANQ